MDIQQGILEILADIGPTTDNDMIAEYTIREFVSDYQVSSESGLRTKRDKLVKAGLVRWTGEKKALPSGRNAKVWEIIPKEE